MREHAEFFHHVVTPQDVGIGRRDRQRRLVGAGHLFTFVLVSLVAVGHAVHIERQDLAAVGDDVDHVAIDGGRGGDA